MFLLSGFVGTQFDFGDTQFLEGEFRLDGGVGVEHLEVIVGVVKIPLVADPVQQ